MKTFKEVLIAILVIVILLGVAFGVGYYFGTKKGDSKPAIVETDTEENDVKLPTEVEKMVVTTDEIKVELQKIGELATFSEEYTIEKSQDYSRYVLDKIKIPGTTNTITVSCTGVLKIGYDISEIEPSVDNDSQKIYISIPEAKVLDNYVIWDKIICEETNTILNPIDFEEYQELITGIEKEGLEKAEEENIYDSAEESLKDIIKDYLSGFDGYEVVFL